MKEKVIKELKAYRSRGYEIEDMKLKIKELKIGEQLEAMSYEDKVQTSMRCKNNDFITNTIEILEKKIEVKEIANKRIDNALKRLESQEDIDVITKVYIEEKSITRASQELFRSRKSIKNAINRAFEKLELV
ncbi:hypothetical protein CLPUN_08480 [Clostridium puniceum]|uniref:Uncharacterized protein n=1 Tax=Clostridium puniceum TaxID=29367 RepID=A0A1S8TVM1_9CLOT|nr:RNA polymerase subunit sigma [Clostridium puniceum]OOM81804.1 hypothetical protein CLPUN_08480 [Clostridium puniceum]